MCFPQDSRLPSSPAHHVSTTGMSISPLRRLFIRCCASSCAEETHDTDSNIQGQGARLPTTMSNPTRPECLSWRKTPYFRLCSRTTSTQKKTPLCPVTGFGSLSTFFVLTFFKMESHPHMTLLRRSYPSPVGARAPAGLYRPTVSGKRIGFVVNGTKRIEGLDTASNY